MGFSNDRNNHPQIKQQGGGSMKPIYQYEALCVNVVDGDTIDCEVRLGFNTKTEPIRFRLLGIDTPEIHGETKEAGEVAEDFVREWIEGERVIIVSHKQDSFGRWLADVYVDGQHVNKTLVNLGLAKIYDK
jgi:micrococcal nuclease